MYRRSLPRPLKTVLAAALLFVSASSKPNMAQNQTPATTTTETKSQSRILGIGGFFLKPRIRRRRANGMQNILGLWTEARVSGCHGVSTTTLRRNT